MNYRPVHGTRIFAVKTKRTVHCARCGREMEYHGGRSGVCRDCKYSMSREEWNIWAGKSTLPDSSPGLNNKPQKPHQETPDSSGSTPSTKASPNG